MSKPASVAVIKWQNRSQGASGDYVEGAKATDKDQSARAIAAKGVYQQALTESFARNSYSKGLTKSGKQGWLNGVEQKGGTNYSTGVGTSAARNKYVTESERYDGARRASDSMPRGPRGSAGNLAKVAAVANALHAIKVAS